MKKLMWGFTLAETITALAIVGVVAGMVLPLLTNNMQKHSSATVLGTAVAQIELGCQNMIQYGNSRILDGSYADTLGTLSEGNIKGNSSQSSVLSDLANLVPSYWGLKDEKIDSAKVKTIKAYGGQTSTTDKSRVDGGTRYSFAKIPADIAIYKGTITTSDIPNIATGYVIYIDTNGWGNYPNRTGKDIFAFNLLNNGTLVPATGTEAGDYAQRVVNDNFKIKY